MPSLGGRHLHHAAWLPASEGLDCTLSLSPSCSNSFSWHSVPFINTPEQKRELYSSKAPEVTEVYLRGSISDLDVLYGQGATGLRKTFHCFHINPFFLYQSFPFSLHFSSVFSPRFISSPSLLLSASPPPPSLTVKLSVWAQWWIALCGFVSDQCRLTAGA